MAIQEEALYVLPERLETDTNWSGIGMLQSNFAAQGAVLTGLQAVGQSNWAGAVVTQVNV